MRARWGLLVVVGALLGCTGCAKKSSERAAPDKSAGQTDEVVASRRVPAAASPKVLDLAVGQWTRHKISENNGRSSMLTYKIVGKEGPAYWLEVVTGAANAGTVIQILLELKDRHDPQSSQIVAARVKMPNGIVKDVRGPMLDATREGYKKALRQVFVPDLSAMPKETIRVPAGTFEACSRHTEATAFAGIEVSSTLWQHPAVPITALVKSVAEGGATTIELVDFGLTGAKSQM
jgi:hypothetical protein